MNPTQNTSSEILPMDEIHYFISRHVSKKNEYANLTSDFSCPKLSSKKIPKTIVIYGSNRKKQDSITSESPFLNIGFNFLMIHFSEASDTSAKDNSRHFKLVEIRINRSGLTALILQVSDYSINIGIMSGDKREK
jgi:hypothetical protein